MKVFIPSNVDDLIALSNTILRKEQSLKDKSNFSAEELAQLQRQITIATDANTRQKELTKLAKELTLTRDNALGTAKKASVNQQGSARFFITGLRDILLGKNKTNPKALGDWGFDVIEETTTSAKKAASTKPKNTQ